MKYLKIALVVLSFSAHANIAQEEEAKLDCFMAGLMLEDSKSDLNVREKLVGYLRSLQSRGWIVYDENDKFQFVGVCKEEFEKATRARSISKWSKDYMEEEGSDE